MHGLHGVDLLFSLLTVLFWIVKSYKRRVHTTFIGIEFLFGIFYAAFYCLRLLRARLRPRAAFTAYALADLFTFVPLFLQASRLRTWLNFSYGRALCALWAYEALEVAGAVDNLSDVRRRLLLFVLRFTALVICFAATMYVFEVLGDPAHVGDRFVATAMGDISFYQMCYFVFITISTVGYGDFSPHTVLGRATVVVLILAGVAFFSVETAELLAINGAEASGRGRFHPRRRGGHVLVAGGAVAAGGATLADFLAELCTPPPGVSAPEVVVLAGREPSPELRALLRQRWAAPHVTLLRGSLLEARDLLRCRVDSARAAFVLADLSVPERTVEDEATVLAAAALRRAQPSLPCRTLLCHADALKLARTAGLPRHACVTAADVAPALLALGARVPGASTLVVNLLRGAPLRASGFSRTARAAWLAHYSHGAALGVIGAPLGDWAANTLFHVAAAAVFAEHGVTLIGVQQEGRLLLAPRHGTRLVAGDIAFAIGPDDASVAAALRAPAGADWRALYNARRAQAQMAAQVAARSAASMRRREALQEALAVDGPVRTLPEVHLSLPPGAPGAEAEARALRALPLRYRPRRTPPPAHHAPSGGCFSPKGPLAAVAAAGGHLLIVAAGDDDCWTDVEALVAPLRSAYLPTHAPVVVLSPRPPPAGFAARHASVLLARGTPSTPGALHAAGADTAARVVHLAGQPAQSGDASMIDRRGVLAAVIVERQAAEWGADPGVTLELHSPASLAYLPQRVPGAGGAAHRRRGLEAPPSGGDLKPEAPPAAGLHARFAAGRATFRTDVSRLFGAELFRPGVFDTLRALTDPGREKQHVALWTAPLPRPAPATYGQLFTLLAAQSVLPLGLLRSPRPGRGADADVDGEEEDDPAAAQDTPNAPYVFTAPPGWSPLRSDDRVYVLASPEWGRAHSDEYRTLRLAEAATVIQTKWRSRAARVRGAYAALGVPPLCSPTENARAAPFAESVARASPGFVGSADEATPHFPRALFWEPMPGGPLLGVDWRWVAERTRDRRRARSAEPPRVVLLQTPGGPESYDVPVHRDADQSSQASEPASEEQPVTRPATAGLLELKLASCAVMLWLLALRVIPASVSLSAMLWPLYLFVLNAWRFPRKVPPRAPASAYSEEPPLSRALSAWRTLMLVVTVLLPLAYALAAPLVLGSNGGRAVLRVFAPPLFLLAAQLLMDSVIADAPDLWVATVALLNPVGFNVLRLAPCWRCASTLWTLSSVVVASSALERWFLSSAALLALANAVLWTANLFVYLLPYKLPQLHNT
jgi:hypothetical protein